MAPKLKMVTTTHIKHKAIRSNVSSLILGSVPTCTMDEDDVDEVVDCNTSGMPLPTFPFFLEFLELSDA